MKKVNRLNLGILREKMQGLTKDEQRQTIGGKDVWRISGGYLYEVDGGVLFCGDDDRSVWFPGVEISSSYVAKGTAYQLNGKIHVSEYWLKDGFNIYDFAHEYGHYIQQYLVGDTYYYRYIAIPSMHDLYKDPEHHGDQWYEKDASKRGYGHLYDQEYY